MKKVLFAFFIIVFASLPAQAHVRKVVAKTDEIITVRTALGIATIVQLPEAIQSAIIGDLSAFKVEHLDRAVTIKPLRWGARTNLYLVTDKRRYNVRLQTGSQESSDYIVYIRDSDSLAGQDKWTRVGKTAALGGLKLSVDRIGWASSGFMLVEATLQSSLPKPHHLSPDDIWIQQSGSPTVINSLYLSGLKVEKKLPLLIGISIARSDFIQGKALSLEIHGSKPVSIELPVGALWK